MAFRRQGLATLKLAQTLHLPTKCRALIKGLTVKRFPVATLRKPLRVPLVSTTRTVTAPRFPITSRRSIGKSITVVL